MNTLLITVNVVCFCINMVCTCRQIRLFHKNTAGYLRYQDQGFLRLRKSNVGWVIFGTLAMTYETINVLALTGKIGGLVP